MMKRVLMTVLTVLLGIWVYLGIMLLGIALYNEGVTLTVSAFETFGMAGAIFVGVGLGLIHLGVVGFLSVVVGVMLTMMVLTKE